MVVNNDTHIDHFSVLYGAIREDSNAAFLLLNSPEYLKFGHTISTRAVTELLQKSIKFYSHTGFFTLVFGILKGWLLTHFQ